MPKVRKSDVVWVEPELVAQVEFAEWTHDGRLRAPVYKGLREDKEPADVRREEPLGTDPARQARARALQPGQALLARGGDHQGRPDRLLPRRRLRARPAPARPPVHDEALPGRLAGEALLPEGRALAHAGLDPDVRVPLDLARDAGEAHAPLPARQRRARPPLDGEHGLHRHEHLVLAGGQARAAGLGPLRPRPLSGRAASRRSCGSRCSIKDVLDALGLVGFPKTSGADGIHVLVPDRPPVRLRPDEGVRRDRGGDARAPPPRASSPPSGRRRSGAASSSTRTRTVRARRSPACTRCARRPARPCPRRSAGRRSREDLDPAAFTMDVVLDAGAARR